MVLFNLPNSTDGRGIVISCWRRIKAPRIFSAPTQVDSCSAFRVVTLDMGDYESVVLWSYTFSTVRFCFFFFRDGGMSACHLYSKNPKLLRRVFCSYNMVVHRIVMQRNFIAEASPF